MIASKMIEAMKPSAARNVETRILTGQNEMDKFNEFNGMIFTENPNLEFRDISNEMWRTYVYPDGSEVIPFFMKQMGGYPDKHGEIPEDLQVFEFPNVGD
jgi:hypothetical protein